MSAKKKAPQIDAGLFLSVMPDAAGEPKITSPAKTIIPDAPQSSAVKGVAVADGAIAPLTARSDSRR